MFLILGFWNLIRDAGAQQPTLTGSRLAQSTRGHVSRSHKDCNNCHRSTAGSSGNFKALVTDRLPGEPGIKEYGGRTSAGNRSVLNGPSKLCLSCHDGVTAADNHGLTVGAKKQRSRGFLVNKLGRSRDHPIGVSYPPRDRWGMPLPGYHFVPRGNVKLVQVGGDLRVECTSCHNPHGGPYKMNLRDDMFRSALCLKCHDL